MNTITTFIIQLERECANRREAYYHWRNRGRWALPIAKYKQKRYQRSYRLYCQVVSLHPVLYAYMILRHEIPNEILENLSPLHVVKKVGGFGGGAELLPEVRSLMIVSYYNLLP